MSADIELRSGYRIETDSWVIQISVPVSAIDFRRQGPIVEELKSEVRRAVETHLAKPGVRRLACFSQEQSDEPNREA